MAGVTYLISAKFNAPTEAFDEAWGLFFQGMSLDDLPRPAHLNANYFGPQPLRGLGAFNVIKNPQMSADWAPFDAHIPAAFVEAPNVAA